jgi:hypothetical protein
MHVLLGRLNKGSGIVNQRACGQRHHHHKRTGSIHRGDLGANRIDECNDDLVESKLRVRIGIGEGSAEGGHHKRGHIGGSARGRVGEGGRHIDHGAQLGEERAKGRVAEAQQHHAAVLQRHGKGIGSSVEGNRRAEVELGELRG